MNRRQYGLHQYQYALRRFTWIHVETKKLALASIITALMISGGVTFLMSIEAALSQSKPHTAAPSASNTSSHPLLDLYDSTTTLLGTQESPQWQQQVSSQNPQAPAMQSITNGVMHQTTVTINGESIEIPPRGASHQTIRNQDGSHTSVDIQHEQTQANGTSRSNIIIDSRSTADNSPTSLNSRITITH